RSHVRTIAFILSGELIAKMFYIDFELVPDDISASRCVIFSVMPRSWIGSLMLQFFAHTQLFRHKSPVFVQAFEFPDKIGKHVSIRIDEPIQLVRSEEHTSELQSL